MLYAHKGPLILVCVSQRTDIYEMSQFLDQVYNYVQNESTKQDDNLNSTRDNETGDCYQEYNAEELYTKMGKDLTQVQTEWNDNPSNRSKAAQLFEKLTITQQNMIDAQRVSMERGEKT